MSSDWAGAMPSDKVAANIAAKRVLAIMGSSSWLEELYFSITFDRQRTQKCPLFGSAVNRCSLDPPGPASADGREQQAAAAACPVGSFFGIVALNYRLPGFFDRAIVSGNFTNPKQQQNQGVTREGAIA
jgi:hypothetical protein